MSENPPLFAGTVTHPPPDKLLQNAREELSPTAFESLMRITGGQPPTAAQLVAAVEEYRNGTWT